MLCQGTLMSYMVLVDHFKCNVRVVLDPTRLAQSFATGVIQFPGPKIYDMQSSSHRVNSPGNFVPYKVLLSFWMA